MKKALLFLLFTGIVNLTHGQTATTETNQPYFIPLDTLLSFAYIKNFSDIDPRAKALGLAYRNLVTRVPWDDHFYTREFEVGRHGHVIALHYLEMNTCQIIIEFESSITDLTTVYNAELAEHHFAASENCAMSFKGENMTQYCLKNEKNWVLLCETRIKIPSGKEIKRYTILVGLL